MTRFDATNRVTVDDLTKPWYASAGVWGAVVTLLCSALSLVPRGLLDPSLVDDLHQWLLSLVALAGGGVALWGRVRATRRIAPLRRRRPRRVVTREARNHRRFIALLGALSLLPLTNLACSALHAPAGAYVAADRATYDAVAPEYSAYVHNDPNLGDDERARRDRTLETWRVRLEAAERNAGVGADAVTGH